MTLAGALAKWVLAAMLLLEPRSPFVGTFETTAAAIAAASTSLPAFAGDAKAPGELRTAAVLVAIAWWESRFRPDALGDCKNPKRPVLAECASLGLFQVNRGWAAVERLLDPERAAPVAAVLVKDSARVCKGEPAPELLSWYAAGGAGCSAHAEPRTKSRHRMATAEKLLASPALERPELAP